MGVRYLTAYIIFFVLSVVWLLFGQVGLILGNEGDASYRIGMRDLLHVSIYAGGEEQIAVDLTVSEKGMVNFPFLGVIKAGGFTTSQLEEKVTPPLKAEYFVDPQIHIQIKEYQSLTFSISGAVKRPGKYKMESTTTVLDLIAKAEGVTREHGSIAYILKSGDDAKKKGAPYTIDLLKLLNEGDASYNITLTSGDSVYIPLSKGLNQTTSKVYVSGQVDKPGIYEYQPGLTALSACIMAGGFSRFAAPNRATIVRGTGKKQKVIKIDLKKVVKGELEDFSLQPGDRVSVPETWL